jgi:hypothetical protein
MDTYASRIIELVVEACTLSGSSPPRPADAERIAMALLQLRADLLALAAATTNAEAADAACGAVEEIDDALACLAAGGLAAAV